MENLLLELKKEISKIGKFSRALEVLHWDSQTYMPRKAAEQRAEIIENLSGEIFKLKTSKNLGELIEKLSKEKNKLSEIDNAILRVVKKEYNENKKIPEDRYRAYVLAASLSENAWYEAKEKSDFEIFKPHLKKMIDFKREFVGYIGYKKNKYDTLLNQYEEGLTVEKLDIVFGELKESIIKLVKRISESAVEIDNSFLFGEFDKNKQIKLSNFILSKIGYDLEAGRLDESVHPFTIGFGNKDVRVTTNFKKNEITNAIFSTIHEGGHGIYEQNIPDELQLTTLDSALAMSIHESQSRFYENLIGRSEAFLSYILNYIKYEFPEFKEVTVEEFYSAVNKVVPSLIRVDADELTYSIHIIIRYEIEKALINGDIDVETVSEAWNDKYEKYLGVRPKNDGEGILQDIHWSDGSFGYFPSYALGNLYGAQMLNKMELDIPGIYDQIKLGNLKDIKLWLKDNVHKYGAMYNPSELIKIVTEEELNSKYFKDYLEEKYSKLYKLDNLM